jgi:endonuclease I
LIESNQFTVYTSILHLLSSTHFHTHGAMKYLVCLAAAATTAAAAAPAAKALTRTVGQKTADEYYAGIDASATDDELKGQLQALVYPHVVFTYDEVWMAFESVDHYLPTYQCDDNAEDIPDIYSSYCWPESKECGNYKAEGDCFNREHIWPKSWFGGFDMGQEAETDLFELWPSDGYVNGLRGDLPLGPVDKSTITYTSTNGCLVGYCDNSTGYTGRCFEPADLYKGDIARSYFYLSTAYWNKWSCCDTVQNDGSDMKTWMENVMRSWHAGDPVDKSETERNDEIYTNWQENRNPFIDHPEWVEQISDF